MKKNVQIPLTKANIWLFWAIALYFLMNGAQIWETALFIPAWTEAPPASLHFFEPPYGIDLKTFWIVVHTIHEVVLIIALIYGWKITKRRNWMLLLMFLHISVRIWTLTYFAPAIIEFQSIDVVDKVDQGLVENANQWETLNYIRVGSYLALNLCFLLLFKINSNK